MSVTGHWVEKIYSVPGPPLPDFGQVWPRELRLSMYIASELPANLWWERWRGQRGNMKQKAVTWWPLKMAASHMVGAEGEQHSTSSSLESTAQL